MKKLLFAALFALACSPASAADNITVKDGAAANKTMCAKDIGSGVLSPCHTAVDSTGVEINDTTLHAEKVVQQANENHVGEVSSHTVVVACDIAPCFTTTSATTAWSLNQLIADSTTAGSVTKMTFNGLCRVSNGTGMIRRVRIKIASDTGFAGANVVLYLYKSSPTLSAGDRAAWLTTESNYIGKIPLFLNNHFSDFEKGIGVPTDSNGNPTEINYDCNGTTGPTGLLVANGAITPQAGSKAVTVVIEGITN